MRLFITTFLKFSLYIIPLYLICLIIIYHSGTAKYIPNIIDKSSNNGFLLSRLRELTENKKNVDYLFLGSSHAFRGFDPRVFQQYGFSSFNLGSSAQSPINSEYLFAKYADVLSPKHVIIEVYFYLFGNDGVESALDIISNSEIDFSNLSLALSKPTLRVYNTVSFIAINRLFEPLNKIKQKPALTMNYIRGGYVQRIAADSINRKLSISPGSQKIYMNPDQVSALTRIIEFSKSRGIKVTLVAAPVTSEFLSQYQNYGEFYGTIERIALSYKIQYVDYNYPANTKFSSLMDFYDTNHLTQRGVEKFNKDLIEQHLAVGTMAP